MRKVCGFALACAVAGLVATQPVPAEERAGRVATGAAVDVPGGGLSVVRVHHYRMAGRVRPLLFWIGRDDVGIARIVWRGDGHGTTAYELLVGTDPARAPRRVNRWGFIAERADRDGGALLALMTRADEASYADAAAAAGPSAGEFRAIRGHTAGGVARWEVSRVRVAAPLTVHDLDAAMASVAEATPAAPRQAPVAPGTRPGFLVAVAELLDLAVAGAPGGNPVVRYAFGQGVYQLRLGQVKRLLADHGTARVPAVHAPFEITNLATGVRTRFEITSGTAGELAGVPLLIQWQPRWWLKVELHLQPEPHDAPPAPVA